MTDKIALGVIGEKFVTSVAKSIFKADYRIKHVDWEKYNTKMGHGLDIRVFQRSKQVMGIEVKNWKRFDRPYGTKIAREEILERFKNFAGGLKVLLISFLCMLTKKALRLLAYHNIHVVEIGKLVGGKDFKSKLFYQVKARLQSIWHTRNERRQDLFTIKLDNYINRTNNINHTIIHTTIQHDTELQDNYLVDWIFNLLQQTKKPKFKGMRIPNTIFS